MQSRSWNVTARGRGSRGAFVVNPGDIGLRAALERLSAADASLSRNDDGTLAGNRYFGEFLDLPPYTITSDRAARLLGFTPILFDTTLRAGSEWHGAQPRRTVDENRLLVHA
jgi:hypothetical protein